MKRSKVRDALGQVAGPPLHGVLIQEPVQLLKERDKPPKFSGAEARLA